MHVPPQQTSPGGSASGGNDYGSLEAPQPDAAPLAGDAPVTWRTYLSGVQDRLPVYLMPWGMFALVLYTMVLVDSRALATLSLGFCVVLSAMFICLSKGKNWYLLSWICLASVALAFFLAGFTAEVYVSRYVYAVQSRWYSNVRPEENPQAKKDAIVIGFSVDAFVDVSRSVGVQSGALYCAAPVVKSLSQASSGYWAVGQDCCQVRGRFQCGDFQKEGARSSVVVTDAAAVRMYASAAKAAAANYGMTLLPNPTFVYFTDDTNEYAYSFWTAAVHFVVGLICVFLCIALAFACVLPGLGGTLLPTPYPDEAKLIQFGCECRCLGHRESFPKQVEAHIERDLLTRRTCWSGEVLYDFIFHVCNNHMFIGVLGCHPSHPYSQIERTVVCLCVSLLVVFPVSALSEVLGHDGLLRLLIILACATVPRNIIKQYLLRVVVQDSEAVLLHGRSKTGQTQARALVWEAVVMILLVILTAVVCFASLYLIGSSARSAVDILKENLDGLGFAFILEPLFDVLVPHVVKGDNGKMWLIGFFGKWMFENDHMQRRTYPEARLPGGMKGRGLKAP